MVEIACVIDARELTSVCLCVHECVYVWTAWPRKKTRCRPCRQKAAFPVTKWCYVGQHLLESYLSFSSWTDWSVKSLLLRCCLQLDPLFPSQELTNLFVTSQDLQDPCGARLSALQLSPVCFFLLTRWFSSPVMLVPDALVDWIRLWLMWILRCCMFVFVLLYDMDV